jgi:hypothetical protein
MNDIYSAVFTDNELTILFTLHIGKELAMMDIYIVGFYTMKGSYSDVKKAHISCSPYNFHLFLLSCGR